MPGGDGTLQSEATALYALGVPAGPKERLPYRHPPMSDELHKRRGGCSEGELEPIAVNFSFVAHGSAMSSALGSAQLQSTFCSGPARNVGPAPYGRKVTGLRFTGILPNSTRSPPDINRQHRLTPGQTAVKQTTDTSVEQQ